MKKLLIDNKWLSVVIVLEIIYLVITGLIKLITPPVTVDYPAEELTFAYDSMELVTQEADGSYTIYSDNWALEADAWKVGNISLKQGTYDIVVDYAASGILSSAQDCRLTISSEDADTNFGHEVITLSNHTTEVSFPIYVKARQDDILISVHYGGLGALNIKEVHIRENKTGRLGIWLHQAVILAVFDLLWAILFHEKVLPYRRRTILFQIICIVTFASLPVFGDTIKSGHDLLFHMGRIEGVANALAQGQFPVRIYHSAFNGYGYASSLFYGDILLYFPAILHLLGFPLFRAYQYYVICVNLATCLITYQCCKHLFADKKIGILCALLYTCSLYRLICIYSRAAVGEYSAMIFFPLLVYGIWTILEEKSKCGWLWLTIGTSGILQTHTLSTEMALLFCVLSAVILIRKWIRPKIVLQLLKAIVAVILLNLWFVIPFLQHVGGDYRVNHITDVNGKIVSASGLYLGQIFGVFTGVGGANKLHGSSGEISMGIGLSLSVCLFLFIKYCLQNEKTNEKEYHLGKLTFGLSLIALWMTSVYFPWNHFRFVNETIQKYVFMVQFPWRYLSIASIMLVITGGCAMKLLLIRDNTNEYRLFYGILIGAVIIGSGYYFFQFIVSTAENEYYDMTDEEIIMDTFYWYAESHPQHDSDILLAHEDSVWTAEYANEKGHITFFCSNNSNEDKRILLPLAYYPDYCAKDAGKQELTVEKSDNGQVALVVPGSYEGNVDVYFRIPVLWRISEWISFLTLVIGAGCFLYEYIVRIRQKAALCQHQLPFHTVSEVGRADEKEAHKTDGGSIE